MNSALKVSGVSKQFDATTVLDDLSFTAPAGAVTGLIGCNGSGKTTTLRMALGFVVADSGTATIAGKSIGDMDNPRQIVGATVDRIGAHPGMTARQHLVLLATASGIELTRVDEVLSEVGLTDVSDRKVKAYSTGMGQRLALAAALLGNPHILILDEPSSGLDPVGIRWLRDLLRNHTDHGGSVVISTHQLAELEVIVDYVVLIDAGRLVTQGPIDEVLGQADVNSIEEVLLKAVSS